MAARLVNKPVRYARYPILECLKTDGSIEDGIVRFMIARRKPDGKTITSLFLVDTFCLGVKDVFYNISDQYSYEETVRPRIIQGHYGTDPVPIAPACVRKLVEGAVQYARSLGFSPHKDFKDAKGIFGDIDPADCTEQYEYGKDGKPFYIRGPLETEARSRAIVNQLHRKCGEGNYNFTVGLGDFSDWEE